MRKTRSSINRRRPSGSRNEIVICAPAENQSRRNEEREDGRGSRIEDRGSPHTRRRDPRSSILDPRSSIFAPPSSLGSERLDQFDQWRLADYSAPCFSCLTSLP